ncbi:MAG TPA: hypothetical protein VJR58_00620 [Vineibacter sp.]|nr:hypothetical protein [Vineibacter sp.]
MKRMRSAIIAIAAGLAATGVVAQEASGPIEIESMLEGRKTITPDWPAINAQPLGSRGNPVRVYRPQGERDHLQRLVCTDGNAPAFRRIGSFGVGPYTTIIDGYDVDCGGTKSVVFMDMYHPGHSERRPVPGFTIRTP